jgi:hypothetical protein
MGIWLASLEDVKAAMDMAETARADALVARQIDAASRSIEALCHRRFYPELATRTFDWPNCQMGTSYRLWLDQHDLISVTTLTSAGTEIASTDYFLRPDHGPPYRRIELDLGDTTADTAIFGGGSTHQRAISVVGLWGYRDDSTPAGTLAAAVSTTSVTTVTVSDSSAVKTGHLLKVGSERVQVTARSMVTTGQTINGALTASKSDVSVLADDGTTIYVGEVILIDSERMLVVDIAGNTLTVRRAWDGSVLAAHSSGATVYAPRQCTVVRGVLGTTAATHLISAAITRWTPPADVEQLCIDEAIWRLQNTLSGMARMVGEGEGARMVNARTITLEREDVFRTHGRIRKAAI